MAARRTANNWIMPRSLFSNSSEVMTEALVVGFFLVHIRMMLNSGIEVFSPFDQGRDPLSVSDGDDDDGDHEGRQQDGGRHDEGCVWGRH